MSKNIVSRTLSVHKEHELLLKLENAGLNDGLAQKVIDSKDNRMAREVVALVQGGTLSSSQEEAKRIMGKNFFGVEEAGEHFKVKPTNRDLRFLSAVPFNTETLESCRETHILVVFFPHSVWQLLSLFPSGMRCLEDRCESFAHPGELDWCLIRKEPAPGSLNTRWDDWRSCLRADETLPPMSAVLYGILACYFSTGARLFADRMVLCSDRIHYSHRGSCRAGIGQTAENQPMEICFIDEESRHPAIGLASMKKIL